MQPSLQRVVRECVDEVVVLALQHALQRVLQAVREEQAVIDSIAVRE